MAYFISIFKCKICFNSAPALSPNLVDSGYASPFDGKCPICNTIHNLKTGEIVEDLTGMTRFVASQDMKKDVTNNGTSIIKTIFP